MILANHGIISSSGGLPPSTLLTNLYSVYKAENNANDSFGSNNGTAVGGLTYTTGVDGNAFSFNGTNSAVNIGNNILNFTGNFSVSMRVKFNSLASSNYLLFNYSAGGTYGYGWGLYTSTAPVNPSIIFDVRSGATTGAVYSPRSITLGLWYNIVAVREVGQPHKIYWEAVDTGATYYVGNSSNAPSYPATQECTLGKVSTAYFNGDIDECYIWNKALTQDEVTELATNFYPF